MNIKILLYSILAISILTLIILGFLFIGATGTDMFLGISAMMKPPENPHEVVFTPLQQQRELEKFADMQRRRQEYLDRR